MRAAEDSEQAIEARSLTISIVINKEVLFYADWSKSKIFRLTSSQIFWKVLFEFCAENDVQQDSVDNFLSERGRNDFIV